MRGPEMLCHRLQRSDRDGVRYAWPGLGRRMGHPLLGALCLTALGALAAAVPAQAGSPAPTVTAVAPSEGPTEGGTEVRISGGGFRTCTVAPSTGPHAGQLVPRGCEQDIVRFGSEPGLVVAATATEIDAFSPPHAPGGVDVTVTTPGGTSATVAGDHFTFTGPAPTFVSGPLPVVTAVLPHKGPASGFTEITIKGKNLLPPGITHCIGCAGVVVHFGSLSVPVLEGTGSELGVVAPPHSPGTVSVAVTTTTGTNETSGYGLAPTYTYLPVQPPHHHHHHGKGHGRGSRYGARHFDSSNPIP